MSITSQLAGIYWNQIVFVSVTFVSTMSPKHWNTAIFFENDEQRFAHDFSRDVTWKNPKSVLNNA